jgi:hypothetical protein
MSATIFAVVFGLVGGCAVLLVSFLAPAPLPEQEFVTGLVVGIFFLYAAWVAGLVGAATGVLYGLVPARARDIWMAMAIGVGVAVAASLWLPRGAYPLFLLSVPIALTAIVSAGCAWTARKLKILE